MTMPRRSRRSQQPDPPPGPQYTFAELVRRSGLPARTLRHWFSVGLIPSPERHAHLTRYDQPRLDRILAAKALREEGFFLEEIRERLDAPRPAPEPPPAALTAPATDAELWRRIVLIPGLELLVSTAAGPLAQRLAEEIRAAYAPPQTP